MCDLVRCFCYTVYRIAKTRTGRRWVVNGCKEGRTEEGQDGRRAGDPGGQGGRRVSCDFGNELTPVFFSNLETDPHDWLSLERRNGSALLRWLLVGDGAVPGSGLWERRLFWEGGDLGDLGKAKGGVVGAEEMSAMQWERSAAGEEKWRKILAEAEEKPEGKMAVR